MCNLYLKLKLKIKGIFEKKSPTKSMLKGLVFFIYNTQIIKKTLIVLIY